MWLIVLFGLFACVAPAAPCALPEGAVLQIALAPHSPRSLKSGRPIQGTIGQPVYHSACKLFPPGVAAKLTSGPANPRLELTPPGATPITLKAAIIRTAKQRRASAGQKPEHSTRTMIVRVNESVPVPGAIELASAGGGVIAAGAQVRVALQSAHSSKSSKKGEVATARLLEPLTVDGRVLLPEGTLVNGALSQQRRARRPYRAGSLRVNFQSLQLDEGRAIDTSLSVASGQLALGSRVDGEGTITAAALTKKRALINLAISYVAGKILDDVVEEGAKAIYGIAAAGSAETAARYVGLGAGAAIFLLHRGREVKLEPHTELVLTFSRPIEIAR